MDTRRPKFDMQEAHSYFSKQCFNEAWSLLDMTERTADDTERMIRLSHAAHWHWTQRNDCTPTNLAIAYWQLARVYTVAGDIDQARRYAQHCLKWSQSDTVSPYFEGCAYEALARVEAVANRKSAATEWLEKARDVAQRLTGEEQKMLLDDLATITI